MYVCICIISQGVIAVSLWGLTGNGSLTFLRVFRAFRVFKLVRKLSSMRKILISLGACVRPVRCAFGAADAVGRFVVVDTAERVDARNMDIEAQIPV